MKKKTILLLILATGFMLSLAAILLANNHINHQTQGLVYSSTESILKNKTGLLLGTSKYLKSGKLNQYFEYRILAAEALYKAGKVDYIVISGDNSRKDYNEPQDMKDELVMRGIPEQRLILDYAGFRTFDSIYRMKEIFGQNQFTVISQQFHNQRAVYIAKALNINAVGYNAKDVDAYNGFKTKVREKFARVKVILDLLVSKKPKYLGEKIRIEE